MNRRVTNSVQVVDAAGAATRDAAAISAGIPSRALMQRAGAAAAAEIGLRFGEELAAGVVVAAGPGNNGGDGWTIAAALHAVGIRVRVVQCGEPSTPDARAERDGAIAAGVRHGNILASLATGGERVVVDALLGTGFRAGTALHGELGAAVSIMRAMQEHGAGIVAVDLPSGLDATTGVHDEAPSCTLTLTFGSVKRGHLLARELCGTIVALDIGLGAHGLAPDGATLAIPRWFRANLPRIPADAHKGTRKKVVVVGGAAGMAGAAMLAARGALRSGAGMVKCVVAQDSLQALQQGEPAALAAPWPHDDASLDTAITHWADVVLLGPGLGAAHGRELVERVLRRWLGPVVLDADALNAFAGDADALVPLIGDREALLTPHPAEFARLAGCSLEEALAGRFDLPRELAKRLGATVLFKGVPTIVSRPDGDTVVVAEGTPILSTGGAGDVLGGIAATLLAQTDHAGLAGAMAAFAHGRAASDCSDRQVRGYTLDDLLRALPDVWGLAPPAPTPPVLAELPRVGEEGEG